MANHDAVAALPITSAPSQTLLRNVNVARMPYVLFDADDSRTITFTDPTTGAKTIDLLLFGRVFHYDPTDTTTAHDGTSCLVSLDGLRYKLALGSDVFAYAVLDNTIATPPVSPILGDAYLVAAAATGAWVGKSNYIAVKTNRGWEFVNFGIGRFIYVESVDTYYHKNAGGSWVTGFGNQVTTPNSVPLSAAINFGKHVIVENQTTTAPPGSPTVPTAYIIGPSATGAWSGLDGKVAICEVTGAFVVYTPGNGWTAYDKSANTPYTFNGSAWLPSTGIWIGRLSVFSAGGSVDTTGLSGNNDGYTYSATTAPTNVKRRAVDTGAALTYTAKKTGALLRFQYTADVVFAPGTSGIAQTGNPVVLALYRGSESSAVGWKMVGGPVDLIFAGVGGTNTSINDVFEISASDASSHTYRISILSGGYNVTGQSLDVSNLTRRTFSVEEAA